MTTTLRHASAVHYRLVVVLLLLCVACGRGTAPPPAGGANGQQSPAESKPDTTTGTTGQPDASGTVTDERTTGTSTAAPPDKDSLAAREAGPEQQALSDEFIHRMLAPWKGDLDGIVERRYLRILVTFNRTHYFTDKLDQYGIAYDAGKLLEEFLNDRLKTKQVKLQVAFIPVTRDRIFKDLAEGRGDIAMAGLTITPEREALVDFASPPWTTVSERVVIHADEPPVATAEDLSGRTVHVRRSTTYYDSLKALNRRLAEAGKAPVKIVLMPEALEDEDLLEMVNAHLIGATIADDYLAEFWSGVFDDIRMQPASVRSDGRIAWAVRKDAPQLLEAVDAFVRDNPKGSYHYNVLYQKYLRDADRVKNASAEDEIEKFRQVRHMFEKYSNRYSLPWLLVAAQGYQESQLDQKRKSSAGAVGVMQVKPSTAASAPINVRGIEASTEKNIEAGVKYLRFIIDEYYKDAPIDRVNKGLFAIASYNAGPARIAQLRRKAAAVGLDPNKWFGNVEVIAARQIGRETVTYVSNIYKYYVSYRLFVEQVEARRRAREPSRL